MCRSIWCRPAIHLVEVVGFGSVRFPSITTKRLGVSMKTSGWLGPSKMCQSSPLGLSRKRASPSRVLLRDPAINSRRFWAFTGSELNSPGGSRRGLRMSQESRATGGSSFFSPSPQPLSWISKSQPAGGWNAVPPVGSWRSLPSHAPPLLSIPISASKTGTTLVLDESYFPIAYFEPGDFPTAYLHL